MNKKLFFSLLIAIAMLASLVGIVSADGCQTFTRYVTGNSDSGVGGFWAYDTFTSTFTVCPDSEGEGDWIVTRNDSGTFESWSGTSPNGTGLIGDGVEGTINGTWTIYVNGEIDPSAAANLGSVDYQCDHNGQCVFPEPTLALIFQDGFTADYGDDWTWTYVACNGETWVNSAAGNSGDITLKANCPPPPQKKPGKTCAWARDVIATHKYTDEAQRFLKNHPTCQFTFKGYYWYWAAHPELLK